MGYSIFIVFAMFAIGMSKGGFNDYIKLKKCNTTMNGKNLSLQNLVLAFNRTSLKVYNYSCSNSVNVFIDKVGLSAEENLNDDIYDYIFTEYVAYELIGVAKATQNNDSKIELSDCKWYLANPLTGRINRTDTDGKVLECLGQRLCANLSGTITGDELDRAKGDKRNFGPLAANFLDPIKGCEMKKNTYLNVTGALIQEFNREFKGSSLTLPDFDYAPLSASYGTFLFSSDFKKSKSGALDVTSLDNKRKLQLAFNYVLPKVSVEYYNYVGFETYPDEVTLCADLLNLEVTATITMSFGQRFCKSIQEHEAYSVSRGPILICKPEWLRIDVRESAKLWQIISWNVTTKVTSDIKSALAPKINSVFDCEDFRPTRYYLV